MTKTEYIALRVEGEFHWGFSVRYSGPSAAAQSYPVPPPTTLLGALARGLANSEAIWRNGSLWSSTIILLDYAKAVTFRYMKCSSHIVALPAPYTDLIRLFRAPYIRKDHRRPEERDRWFGVAGFGKIYAPITAFEIVYIFDKGVLKSFPEEKLLHAALSITNLGSKESLVSIQRAELGIAQETRSEYVITEFYFPYLNTVSIKGRYKIVNLIELRPDCYKYVGVRRPLELNRSFVVPITEECGGFEPTRVEVLGELDKYVIYHVRFRDREYYILWSG